MTERLEGDVRDVKNLDGNAEKTGGSIRAMALQNWGNEWRCTKPAMCIAAICFGAVLCTKLYPAMQ